MDGIEVLFMIPNKFCKSVLNTDGRHKVIYTHLFARLCNYNDGKAAMPLLKIL